MTSSAESSRGAHRGGDAPCRPGVEGAHLRRHDTERACASAASTSPPRPRSCARAGAPSETGIAKRPASGPVAIGPAGLAGDLIASKKHHGGPDQAVYVYGEQDYAWWSERLGRPLEPGTFGENLTVSELATGDALVGDRLHVGAEVVLEVTCGRIPCGTLTARMGIKGFTRDFREAGRPGLYCRVIEPGPVEAGDDVRYVTASGPTLGIVEFSEMFYAQGAHARAARARPGGTHLRARQAHARASARGVALALSARLARATDAASAPRGRTRARAARARPRPARARAPAANSPVSSTRSP